MTPLPRIDVTRSILPSLEEYQQHVADIFDSHHLTNQGPKVRALERQLKSFLGADALIACANGTLALQLALRMLHLQGKKIITTPFTYVASTSALLWEGCTPIYADIEPDTLCLDPKLVEEALVAHPDAAGILPVHVFGNATDVEAMDALAKKHGVKVLYDAAHAFGSVFGGKSLFRYGDAAVGSFHSTKLFHTVEGGCVVSQQLSGEGELQLLRAFGHVHDKHMSLGINAKMSELHAAMGLCLLPRVPDYISQRRARIRLYDELLEEHGASRTIRLREGLEWNHAYYPRIFSDEAQVHRTMAALEKEDVHPRRYFYPSLTQLPYVASGPCPVADDIANRILCLPLWPDMDEEIIHRTCKIILEV